MKPKASSLLVVGGALSLLALFGVLASGGSVAAQDTGLETVGEAAGLSSDNILVVIGRIIQVILGLTGVIFLILTIYAGFLWMTSEGNEEKIQKAQQVLKNAVIGLIIALAAFAITTFIVNAILAAVGLGGLGGEEAGPGVEQFSDALGSGGLEDHYPPRGGSDIPRNTKIIVTFKEEIYIPSLIVDYDVADTPTDVSDDLPPATAYLNTGNVTIACVDPTTAATTTYTSNQVTVAFTDDLRTFVFDPPVMGSAVDEATCTVSLGSDILEADGGDVFTGTSASGYQWSFSLSTSIDTTPPTIESIYPVDGAEDARNVTVQIIFDEAIDPTTASGTYDEAAGGFTDIQVQADPDETGTFSPVAGTFVITSGYTIVEFTAEDACGTNSCGQTIYCLPAPADSEASEEINLLIQAATVSSAPPEAVTPYDGVVDVAGNALDGNGDGTAGDDRQSDFTVTDSIVTEGPTLTTISPTVLEQEVALDRDLTFIWNEIMRASTLTNTNLSLYADPDHEMYYVARNGTYDSSGVEVTTDTQMPDHTITTLRHGTFVESDEDDPATTTVNESTTQLYAPVLPEEIQSIYQNCFYPAVGPGSTTGSSCQGVANAAYCCDGKRAEAGFNTTTFSCP